MKKLKRLVAVLLVGIMALAVLTACDGTPVTRDGALEKSVAGWNVKLGKNANRELTVDDESTAMSDKCLPTDCGDTPVTRDEALEKSIAEWTEELGKDANLELTVDDELMAMSDKYLPTEVKLWNAYMAEDWEAYRAARNELDDVFAVGTKVARVDVVLQMNGREITKEVLARIVQVQMSDFNEILTKAGIKKPTKFGVTVTKQKEYTLVLFVVSE